MNSKDFLLIKNLVIERIKILDIAKEFSVALEEVYSHNFDYRCKCPSRDHKNGKERTGSCYIDSTENRFKCFGCDASSNCIDFYILCTGSSFLDALLELQKKLDGNYVYQDVQIKKDPFNKLLNISILLRHTMIQHPDDFDWISNLMKKMDHKLSEDCSEELAEKLFNKISELIRKRYQQCE